MTAGMTKSLLLRQFSNRGVLSEVGKEQNIKRFIGRLAFGFERRPMYSKKRFVLAY